MYAKTCSFGFDILFFCDTSGCALGHVKRDMEINTFHEYEAGSLAMSTANKARTEGQRDPNSNLILDKLLYDKIAAIVFLNMQVDYLGNISYYISKRNIKVF